VTLGNRKSGVAPKRGKAVNIYLHEADQVRIRELAAYLASEGQRVSDSQIIKAALLLAQPDKRLLKRIWKLRERTKDTSRSWRSSRCTVRLRRLHHPAAPVRRKP
jgi:hypothetical protein